MTNDVKDRVLETLESAQTGHESAFISLAQYENIRQQSQMLLATLQLLCIKSRNNRARSRQLAQSFSSKHL